MTRQSARCIVKAGRTGCGDGFTMAREYVDSNSVEWFDFDRHGKTLEIAYASGGIYRYFGVPARVRDQLRDAESKGRFVNDVIKKRYRYTCLKAPGDTPTGEDR